MLRWLGTAASAGRTIRRHGGVLPTVAIALCVASAAQAQEPIPGARESPALEAQEEIEGEDDATLGTPPPGGWVSAEARRDPAHYRGRDRDAHPPEEVLAWIPRILFAPLSVITDVLIRRPVLALLAWIEESYVADRIDAVLNPHPDVSWSPTVSFEANVLALVGVRGEWRNALTEGHDVEASFAMGSSTFWATAVEDRWRVGPVVLGVRGGASTRPERPFYGLGPTSQTVRYYYTDERVEALGFVTVRHESHVEARLSLGYSREASGPGIAPSIETLVPANEIPGFGLYELGVGTFDLVLDTRESFDEQGGVRFVGNYTFGYDAREPTRSFMTASLDLEAGVEISVPDRVLVGRVYLMNTLPAGDAAVPLTRLAWLGWDRHRGFIRGRYRGEAAALVELRYRYPIHFNVDLQWVASVGNVFARDASDFDLSLLTGSLGVGFRTRRTGLRTPYDVGIAIGTSHFDQGFSIESVRFFFEATEGL